MKWRRAFPSALPAGCVLARKRVKRRAQERRLQSTASAALFVTSFSIASFSGMGSLGPQQHDWIESGDSCQRHE